MQQQKSTFKETIISSLPPGIQPYVGELFTANGMIILFCCLFLIIANRNNNSKGKLASGRWANQQEIAAARKTACEQMENHEDEKFALYIGTPRGRKMITEPDGKKYLCLPEDPRTIYLPNAQENILYIGRSGSGKTFSSGTPLCLSAIQQGFTVFYYDFKGHENPSPGAKLVDFAKEHGYKVSILDPNSPESGCLNPVTFLKDGFDSETALEIAATINGNLKLSGGGENNGFFTQTGNQLVQGVMMLARSSPYPDIAMCHAILGLPNLVERLKAAKLPQYQKVVFNTFLSSADSPKTAANIATTASIMFSRFMTPKILRTFAGKNTIPLDVDGRHLIIFRMNPNQRKVVAPLLAVSKQLMVNRNVYRPNFNFPRKVPLVVSLDEINSIYIEPLVDWLNQNRSSKFSALLGVQSLGFLEKVYSKEEVDGILGGCTTQIVFQLNDKKTAEYYSGILGEKEVEISQKTRNTGQGKTGYSYSKQKHIRPLMELAQLTRIKRGKAIIINSGQENDEESRIPYQKKVIIPRRDIRAMKKGAKMWAKHRKEMIAHQQNAVELTDLDLKRREIAADKLLPDPNRQECAVDL
ncbi:MAG: TraM recognition domain-containing protein [Xenococcaceae cyanobacterium MO_207.B15]|nr:TraM recognition domain-containing protein [Xenococcaceae cyanobacterium MO_207.B15]